jgi:small subunit ribosomal protein S6
MAKSKVSGPQHYEILFIISNKFTEEEALKSFDKVANLITELTGEITLKDFWGKKKLAYVINREHYGYYGLFEFNLDGSKLRDLDEKLRLDSEIVRFIVIKKKIKSDADLKKEKAIAAKIESKKEAEEKEIEEKEVAKEKSRVKVMAKKEVADISLKSDSKKTDLKSLDEKLDDILKADDLI